MGGKPRYTPIPARTPAHGSVATKSAAEAMTRYVELDERISELEAEREAVRAELLDLLGSGPQAATETSGRLPAPAPNGRRKRRVRRSAAKEQIKAAIPKHISGDGQSRGEIHEGLKADGIDVSPANVGLMLRELRAEKVIRIEGERGTARYFPLR